MKRLLLGCFLLFFTACGAPTESIADVDSVELTATTANQNTSVQATEPSSIATIEPTKTVEPTREATATAEPTATSLAASLPIIQPAPEIANEVWLNSEPMKLSDLRGKVVLVEFWTFG